MEDLLSENLLFVNKWKSCDRKIRHLAKPPKRKWMKAYRCQFCHGWHYAPKSNFIKKR